MFERKVLRMIFDPKTVKKEINNEELEDHYNETKTCGALKCMGTSYAEQIDQKK